LNAPLAVNNLGQVFVLAEKRIISVNFSGPGTDRVWLSRLDADGSHARTVSADGLTTADLKVRGNSVYVAGPSSWYSFGRKWVIMRFNQDIALRWRVEVGSGDDAPVALAVDSLENVYITGYSTPTNTSMRRYLTLRYTSSGILNGSWIYEGPAGVSTYGVPYSATAAVAIAIDRADNVYVTGFSGASYTARTIVTMKLNLGGTTTLWTKSVFEKSFPDKPKDTVPVAIAVDRDGNICVTGYSRTADAGSSYIVSVKYSSSDGSSLW
jgi:hypothetical protein